MQRPFLRSRSDRHSLVITAAADSLGQSLDEVALLDEYRTLRRNHFLTSPQDVAVWTFLAATDHSKLTFALVECHLDVSHDSGVLACYVRMSRSL